MRSFRKSTLRSKKLFRVSYTAGSSENLLIRTRMASLQWIQETDEVKRREARDYWFDQFKFRADVHAREGGRLPYNNPSQYLCQCQWAQRKMPYLWKCKCKAHAGGRHFCKHVKAAMKKFKVKE